MLRLGYRAPAQRLLLVAGFAVLLIIGILSFALTRETKAINDRIDHSLTVLNVIANLRADIRRAESGQRGFLLTGEAPYLNDYNATLGRIQPELEELAALTADNPRQAAVIGELRGVIDQKLAELATTVDLQLKGRHDEAQALVQTDQGLNLMERIAEKNRQASAEEASLLTERRDQANRNEVYLLTTNALGVLAIAALAYFSQALFRRSAKEILDRERALQELNASLEERVAERTSDLEAANAEIQRFAYVVTHDLRSPLVNIMGFTTELEVLRDTVFRRLEAPAAGTEGPAPEGTPEPDVATLHRDFNEAIHFIKRSIAKMDGLIKAILKLSRAGRQELTIQRLDLNEVLQAISADFRHRVRELDAELTIGPMPTVRSDRMAIEQILSNLIDNALKYLRDDVPGRIDLQSAETVNEYRISVIDNGRGVSPADRERIFDLFRRAGAQDKPGEGIGLAHSRGLARRVGGTIIVKDAPGGGSIFTLVLSKLWMARQAAGPKVSQGSKAA